MTEAVATENPLFADRYRSLYNVRLEVFEGPLDLLLHLIKKNELDIYNIPIAEITRQYLEYIRLMKELNLEIAGEFLVMASTLIHIKSKMLLPTFVNEEEADEDEADPRAELVRRLLEYQRYKEAGQAMDGLELLGRDIFARKFPSPELEELKGEEETVEVGLFELVEAFQRILAQAPAESFHEVTAETISIAQRINEILSLLQERGNVTFDDLFAGFLDRERLIVTFLAILELCRLRLVKIVQVNRFGTIWLTPTCAADEGAPGTEDSLGHD